MEAKRNTEKKTALSAGARRLVAIGVLWGAFLLFGCASAFAQSYYVDSAAGSDANSGTSAAAPWASLAKVNAKTFAPGDTIYFKAGGSWAGQLHPLGSGTSGSVIRIDKYGTGALPLINGNGSAAALYLYNQQYWEISNLELTNDNGMTSRRNGVYIVNENAGTLSHIYLRNNNIHNVRGDNVKGYDGSAGILFHTKLAATPSKFNDILIDGNTVGPAVDRSGIVINSRFGCRAAMGYNGTTCTPDTANQWYPSTQVVISNNYVTDAGGDGIVPQQTTGALVQYNTVDGFNMRSGTANAGIWAWNSDNTVFQFNEAFGGHTTQDGEGYDVDYAQTGTVFQYNFSHDNDGGFMLVCGPSDDTVTDQAIIRYNISQNDRYQVFALNGHSTNTKVYNNTIYLPQGSTTSPIKLWNWNGYKPVSIIFKNNIFYLDGAGTWDGLGDIGSLTFESNTIYGAHTAGEPADPYKLTSDPQLVGPGRAGNRGDTDGYKLLAGSPALGSGQAIGGNGGRDYWGNPVSASGAPNRGAYNGAGLTHPVANPGLEAGSLGAWVASDSRVTVAAAHARTGGYSLQLAGSGTSAKQVVAVSPNTTYAFTAYAKTYASGEPVRIGVKDYGGAELTADIATTAYSGQTIVFTTGPSSTSATIYIYKPTGGNWAWADDFRVDLVNPAANAGFESGALGPWVAWQTATVDSTAPRSGAYALKLTGPSSARQTVTLKPNTTYTLKAYAKTGDTREPVVIGVKDYGGAEQTVSLASTAYAAASLTFTTGASSTSATVYVYKPSGAGQAWADDFSITF